MDILFVEYPVCWHLEAAKIKKFVSQHWTVRIKEGVQEMERSVVIYDDPCVAGGPDVLLESAAPPQAETKH